MCKKDLFSGFEIHDHDNYLGIMILKVKIKNTGFRFVRLIWVFVGP